MMHLLTLCLVSFLIVPTQALEVSTTHWPPTPSVVPTSIPTVFPTSAPTATPTSTPNECPPGCLPSCVACATQNGTIACYQGPFCPPGSSPDPGYPHHGHTHIETNIAIQHFTINVGRIDVDIDARENLKSHGGHGHGPVISSADHDASTSSSPLSSSPPSQGQCPPGQAECEKPNRQVVCCPYPINITVCCLGSPPTVSHHTHQPNIQTNIAIGDFTMNVGAIDLRHVDVNKCKRQGHSKPPTWPIITPPGDDTIQFPDDPVSTEPGSDEIVLGESDVWTQGLSPIGGGGVVSTAPAIYSFTYKISAEKKVQVDTTKPLQQVVTFIIRGAHFDISSLLGVDGSDVADGLASLLEPKVFLGAIPLKVVRFVDTYIEARFEDIEDQKSFKPGSYLVRVKMLHVGHKLGILSTEGSSSGSDIPTLGGLSLPELGIIGSGLPVLPVIKSPPPIKSPFTLISLFAGLQFDVASLTVTFCSSDADKIAKATSVM